MAYLMVPSLNHEEEPICRAIVVNGRGFREGPGRLSIVDAAQNVEVKSLGDGRKWSSKPALL
jgi:hypothetical protein